MNNTHSVSIILNRLPVTIFGITHVAFTSLREVRPKLDIAECK